MDDPTTVTDPEEQVTPPPRYVDENMLQTVLEQNNAQLLESLKTAIPAPAPHVPQFDPAPPDNRSPYDIAKAEAEHQGIYSDAWVAQRALAIQSDKSRLEIEAREKAWEEKLNKAVETITGAVSPVVMDRALTTATKGNLEVAEEIRKMIDAGQVHPNALSDPNIYPVVEKAALFEINQRKQAANPFPGAAPLGSTPSYAGIRNQLNAQEKAALEQFEKKFGKYDDEMIAEEFGKRNG